MPKTRDDFYTVLSAAIDDMIANGFDNVERVQHWTRELRAAAERSMVRPESLDQMLRDGLAAVYRKMVDQGGIARYQKGIDRFTLEQIKPMLRGELDRRIMASASLIKLNREEAIEKTLRRFQGWSTSIPPGGVSEDSKAEVRKDIRKSLASLPWEERRVTIDQSAKLVSSINDIIATSGGAIAGRWHSEFRRAGYNFREEHKERDSKFYLIRDSWAHIAGLVKPMKDAGYVDQITAPAQEPFCSCRYVYFYNLRDLPEQMLTAKGKAALASAQGREEVRAARTGRADDATPDPLPKVGYEAQRLRLERLKEEIPL